MVVCFAGEFRRVPKLLRVRRWCLHASISFHYLRFTVKIHSFWNSCAQCVNGSNTDNALKPTKLKPNALWTCYKTVVEPT